MSGKARHFHGCRRCRLRYGCICDTPDEDALCDQCRGVRVWQPLIDSIAPRDCCYERARLASRDERKAYDLAGRSNWFICPVCKRTHPTRPTRPIPKEDA